MSKSTFSIAITKARVTSILITEKQIQANVSLISGNEKEVATIQFYSDEYWKRENKFIPYEVWMREVFERLADSIRANCELSLEKMCNMLGEHTESEVVE
jgi:hypothetical protein